MNMSFTAFRSFRILAILTLVSALPAGFAQADYGPACPANQQEICGTTAGHCFPHTYVCEDPEPYCYCAARPDAAQFSRPATNYPAVVVCRTDQADWGFEIDGPNHQLLILDVHHQVTVPGGALSSKDFFFDYGSKVQFRYDGHVLEIFPGAPGFPEGLHLKVVECFA